MTTETEQKGNHHDNIRVAFTRCRDRFRGLCAILPDIHGCPENEFLRGLRDDAEEIDLERTAISTIRETSLNITNDLAPIAELWMEQARTGHAIVGDIVNDMRAIARLAAEIENEPDNAATDLLDDTCEPGDVAAPAAG